MVVFVLKPVPVSSQEQEPPSTPTNFLIVHLSFQFYYKCIVAVVVKFIN